MVGATVERVLRMGWEGACVEAPRMWPGDRRQVARRAFSSTGLDSGCCPIALAKALGLRVRCVPVRGCGGEITDGQIVVYRWHEAESERRARVAHGLAHALLMREAWSHSETDAILLTHDFR